MMIYIKLKNQSHPRSGACYNHSHDRSRCSSTNNGGKILAIIPGCVCLHVCYGLGIFNIWKFDVLKFPCVRARARTLILALADV